MTDGLDPELASLAESHRPPVDPFAGDHRAEVVRAQNVANELLSEGARLLASSSAPRLTLFKYGPIVGATKVADGWFLGSVVLDSDGILRESVGPLQARNSDFRYELAMKGLKRRYPGTTTDLAGQRLLVGPPRGGDSPIGGILKAGLDGEPYICHDTYHFRWSSLRDFLNAEIRTKLTTDRT